MKTLVLVLAVIVAVSASKLLWHHNEDIDMYVSRVSPEVAPEVGVHRCSTIAALVTRVVILFAMLGSVCIIKLICCLCSTSRFGSYESCRCQRGFVAAGGGSNAGDLPDAQVCWLCRGDRSWCFSLVRFCSPYVVVGFFLLLGSIVQLQDGNSSLDVPC